MSDEINSVIVEPIFEAETMDIFDERNRSFMINAGLISTTDANFVYKPKFPGKLDEACLFDDDGKRLLIGIDFIAEKGYLIISGRPKFPLELAYEHAVNIYVDPATQYPLGMPNVWTGGGTTTVPQNYWINNGPVPSGGITFGPGQSSVVYGVPTYSGTIGDMTTSYTAIDLNQPATMSYNSSGSMPLNATFGGTTLPIHGGSMDSYLSAKASGWSLSGTVSSAT